MQVRLAIGLVAGVLASASLLAAESVWTGGSSGIDLDWFDQSVRSGDDFHSHATGNWLPGGVPKGHWDYGQFNVAARRTEDQIKQLVADVGRVGGPAGSASRLVADAYRAALDTEKIDAAGSKIVRTEVAQLLASRSHHDIARGMATPGSSTIVAINVVPSDGVMRVHLDQQNQAQPMLGLPGRSDYESKEPEVARKRALYRDHVARLLTLAGVPEASSRADRMLALETKIASNQWGLERLRDRKANHFRISAEELPGYAPGFPWRTFLQARGVGRETQLVLGTNTALQAQAKLFAATAPEDWTTYLAYHWVQNRIDFLPKPFRDAELAYRRQRDGNNAEPPPRDELSLRFVNSALSEQVGRLYVERHFDPKVKAAAIQMTNYLRRAFRSRLEQATCLDDRTRREALAKLATMKLKVGHPSVWQDHAGLILRPDDAAGNLKRLHDAAWHNQIKQLDSRNRAEMWYQSPQTVDATYSVLLNAIELPAAILQPPFFDATADPAAGFGGIGTIIGHEIVHGFDDQGILFDAKGSLRDWWSPAAMQCFKEREKAVTEQYSRFSPLEGLKLDGRRTVGENIADLTGLSIAHDAYRLFLGEHPRHQGRKLDGLSDDQRFFVAYAQIWSYRAPDDAIRHILANSYRPPAKYRVNGAVRNSDAWYRAFGVRQGDKLYLPKSDRVTIW